MKIETGLLDHMVVQRNPRNVSEAAFDGVCGARGPVTATVRQGKRVLKGFADVRVGAAAGGKMSGCLKGLPVGGPYDIEVRVGNEATVVKNVLVGDVWLLGGQSNMQGYGFFPKKRLPVDPSVRAFYMDDRWAQARDPIHNMWDCVDPVHVELSGGIRPAKNAPDRGVCPGPAFGNEMRRLTGVPQGLIACAHGGTSMAQWDPKRKKEGGKSLYGAMVRRLIKNGCRVAGLVWYQGCSDAIVDPAPLYTKRMKEFISALRRDSGDRTLPVAMVQIARVVVWDTVDCWKSIQEQQRRLPHAIKHLATVPAIDLSLDDTIHISGKGQYVLGVRLAQAMQVLREGRRAGLPPIELEKVTVENVHGLGVAVAEFKHVVGSLRSGDRPSGFSIVASGVCAKLFDIELDGRSVRVRSCLAPDDLVTGYALHYGFGGDPYCNVVDEAGRSLPVFGPARMGVPHAITPFIRELRVSAFQPSAGRLKGLECPSSLAALQMVKRTFPEPFCSLHGEIIQRGGRDEVVYYACRFTCKEAMPLALVLGYDGPVKAWVDGKRLIYDPNGTNPAVAEKGRAPFKAAAGAHEIVVALGTHHGAAWGIFLRLERLGVPRRLRDIGPSAYTLPEILG